MNSGGIVLAEGLDLLNLLREQLGEALLEGLYVTELAVNG